MPEDPALLAVPVLNQALYDRAAELAGGNREKAEKLFAKLKEIQLKAQNYSQCPLQIDVLLQVGKKKDIDKIRFTNLVGEEFLFSRQQIDGQKFTAIETPIEGGSQTTSIGSPDEEGYSIVQIEKLFTVDNSSSNEEWMMSFAAKDLEFFAVLKEYFDLLKELKSE